MNRDRAFLIGGAGLAGCIAGFIFVPRDALIAWLVAWLAWGSIPIGALAVLMLVALIPGSWRDLYVDPLTLGTSLVPLVAIAIVPLLVGIEVIYPWTSPTLSGSFPGFKGAWLSTGFFIIRAIIYMGVLSLIARSMLSAAPAARPAIAAIGVILYALIGSLIGIDFAETTEPDFHSSIYGLLALANQWLAGISFAILIGLWSKPGKAPRAASGVLITAILIWGYMHAMQYIVIWAGDIPREARWYIERGEHGWGALAWILYGLQGLVSFAALLSPSVRSSRRAMMGLAGLTLLMRLIENAWLVLPGITGLTWPVAPLILAASMAMFGLCAIALSKMLQRTGKPALSGWDEQRRSV